MSCTTGDKSCDTPRRRGALFILGLMAVIFFVLSYLSFIDERGQVVPDDISYKGYSADEGKRIFQAYNCMGCHTIVGNGGYFAPDLTKTYAYAGPAWLEAFIPSAGRWPTETAVKLNLSTPEQLAEAGVTSYEDYLEKYPGTFERIDRRKGTTHMPNLAFREGEVQKLIAFLKYSSAINTEGWPPEVRTGTLEERLELAYGKPNLTPATAVSTSSTPDAAPEVDLVAVGKAAVEEKGCVACHRSDATRTVGPGWQDLYGSTVTLDNGSTVKADKAYLVESILEPNAKVVASYPAGVMFSYKGMVSDDELEAMVAYLISLSSYAGESQ